MKKSNGEGTIRKRPNGTWEARYYANGKRRSVYGDTKADVRKKLTKVQAEIDSGDYLDETNMTMGQWMMEWLEQYCTVRPRTRERYEMDIRNHVIPAIGKIKLKELKPRQLQQFYNEIKVKISAKSVKNLHGIIHNALKTAVNMDMIKYNVSERCMLPKLVQPEMHPLMDEDVQNFLKAIENDPFRDLFMFDMFTGLRRGELVGLTWDCIDFTNNTIHVYQQMINNSTSKERGQYSFGPLKNGKSRTIEPAEQVMDILRRVKAEQEENARRLKSAYNNEYNLVFTYANGHPISDNTVYNRFKTIVRKMGRPEVRFHDLRHTFATLSTATGADIKTVSMSLGHATVAFTLDRYGHVSQSMRRDAANKMTAFIGTLELPEA